jgi:hypothetical protein
VRKNASVRATEVELKKYDCAKKPDRRKRPPFVRIQRGCIAQCTHPRRRMMVLAVRVISVFSSPMKNDCSNDDDDAAERGNKHCPEKRAL